MKESSLSRRDENREMKIGALILSCEHGGNRVPAPYTYLFKTAKAQAALNSHRGWDIGALAVAKALAHQLDLPLFAHDITRLLVDPNRSLGHPKLYSEFSKPLDTTERKILLDRCYHPHRTQIEAAIAAAIREKGSVLHLAVHSFTPILDGVTRRAEVALLYDPRRPNEKALCRFWQSHLTALAPDLKIRRNTPYRGNADGLTTALRRKHGAARYLGIEIEINQALLLKGIGERKKLADLIGRSIDVLQVQL